MRENPRIEVLPHRALKNLKIVRDKDLETLHTPLRVQVGMKDLARMLELPMDLLKVYARCKAFHEGTSGETAGGMGLCSEELAAFAIAGHLHARRNLPHRKAPQLVAQIQEHLLECTRPDRVHVFLLEGNHGHQVEVRTGVGRLLIEASLRPYTTIFDATELQVAIEASLTQDRLKLPSVSHFVVTPT